MFNKCIEAPKCKCKCNCPQGTCEHNWTEQTEKGVCRECGESWKLHRDMIIDEMQFEELLRYC